MEKIIISAKRRGGADGRRIVGNVFISFGFYFAVCCQSEISFYFRLMDQSGRSAENKSFFDEELQSFMQRNDIRLDSQAEEALTQKVVACLQQVIYVTIVLYLHSKMASTIQKKCRRKTLAVRDMSKSIEICGYGVSCSCLW